MKTYISCYNKPLSEFSIPIGDEKFSLYGRMEIDCWLRQLKRTFPLLHGNFVIKEHLTADQKVEYWEVVFEYEDDENSRERAQNIVEELPYEWDFTSRETLGQEYFNYINLLMTIQIFFLLFHFYFTTNIIKIIIITFHILPPNIGLLLPYISY